MYMFIPLHNYNVIQSDDHYHIMLTHNHAVPPSVPDMFRVDESSITSVFARLQWTNTNQTADEGAETLTLLLMFSNMRLAQQIELSGDTTQVTLDLIPGTEYSARLRAENPSGMVITDAITFSTLDGC